MSPAVMPTLTAGPICMRLPSTRRISTCALPSSMAKRSPWRARFDNLLALFRDLENDLAGEPSRTLDW